MFTAGADMSSSALPPIAFDFFFDPLCGWCYGAAPTIAALRGAFPVHYALWPMGLFYRDSVRPMDAGIADYIRRADQRLSQMTGQPLGKPYLDRLVRADAPALNSGPGIRAILAAETAQAGAGLDLQETLQKARFVDGRDITDAAEIAAIAAAAEIALATPAPEAEADRRVAETRRRMQRYGLQGVPALVLHGTGDWQGQLETVVPGQLLYDAAALKAWVADTVAARS
jgi:putative protein-disulfide isomerase